MCLLSVLQDASGIVAPVVGLSGADVRLAAILSIGASALLGAGALFAARVLLPQDAAQAAPITRTTAVVVALNPISHGARVEAKDLAVLTLPADAAPEGAWTQVADITKLDGGAPVALADIVAGEALLPSRVSGAGAKASLASMIAPGMRAYTIKVSDSAGVGGHALPGDHVDVVLAREAGPGRIAVDVVLQNVRLLGLNLNADPASTDKARPETATLEVAPLDAGRLSVAGKTGLLSLALRRSGSTEVEAVHAIALAGTPAPAAPRASRPRPAAEPASQGLVVVHGATRTTVNVPTERKGAGA